MKHTLFLLAALPLFLFAQNEKGVNPVKTPPSGGGGATRAVVIGISDYQDAQIPDLRFAHRDAEAFANFLKSPAGGGLDGDHLQVLLNQNATAGRVAEALDALIEQAKEGDEVVIYFSGHGDVERKTVSQPGFLLCWDAPSRVYMGGGTYSLAYLQEIVTTLSTQNKARVVVVTDACHAGKLAGSQIGGSQLTAASMAKQFSNEVKILSCQPGELSLEGEQWGGGRGIFSYHLIDGLFGLADRNADGQVSLGELDRYLEDKVTAEAAPQSQVPMLLGNKTEKLATVNAAILADLKKAKARGLPVFAATESRGMEDVILAKVDSSIRQQYLAFKKAIAEKRFFEPEDDCAEKFYTQLLARKEIADEGEAHAPLRNLMKRNYAAALQDDAQQAMNIWLKADVQQLQCGGTSLHFDAIPRQLGRAAELLGEEHYMHRSLLARKLLFEGIIMQTWNRDETSGKKLLHIFRQSADLEPNSPIAWHRMCLIQALNLKQPDSAFACAEAARNLAPNWVLPYVDLAFVFTDDRKFDFAEKALQMAESIDSLHPYTYNRRALLLLEQGNAVMAAEMLKKYVESDGPLYPCWHNNYAKVLMLLGNYPESETEYRKALALDSTRAIIWNNLGAFYLRTRRLAEAEQACLKAYALDSTSIDVVNNLAIVYKDTRRYPEAEFFFKKALEMDSSQFRLWNNLGAMYIDMGRYDDGERAVKRANRLDTSYVPAWLNLGRICSETKQWEQADQYFQKALSLNPNFGFTYLNLAALKAKMGDAPAATELAEQAILKGLKVYDYYKAAAFDPLRELPEWKALMKKHFPDQAKD
ncbi:MAG: tetratricopeptide repeat protein [Saprospiraceae bacterium]